MSGDFLKILAISNVEGCAERIVDALGNKDVSIIAKEESIGLELLSERVSAAMNKGAYEYAIVAVEDHVGATVLLNKSGSIRAAVCDSAEDVRLARKNDVNVMIVRADQKRFDYLGSGIAQAQKPQERREKPEKAFESRKQEEKPRKQAEQEEDDQDEEEEDYRKSGGKGGIFGRLKDHLGIIDEDEEK